MQVGGGRYLVRQGAGYRFQMAVPQDIQALVGKKVWRRYLSAFPECQSEDQAAIFTCLSV